jgi:transcription antitermination factor NusG
MTESMANVVAYPPSWYAVVVRTQHEKQVAIALEDKGFEYLLPLYRVKRRWNNTSRQVDLPLFPNYTFCRFSPSRKLPILQIPGVRRVVSFGGRLVPIDEFEIKALQVLAGSGLPVSPCAFLQQGDRVRLQAGPLKGVEGILLKFKGTHRLVVSVSVLQRSVCVEVDQDYVVPAPVSANANRFAMG